MAEMEGRIEWLDAGATGVDPPRVMVAGSAGSGSEPIPARRCPRCGWLDGLEEIECFRCGEEFDPAGEALAALAACDLEPPATRVHMGSAAWLTDAGHAEPFAEADLRQRVAARALEPGFSTLLCLGQVDHGELTDYPFQREAAVRVLRDMGGQALLADETGLGKTIEAGLVIKELIVRGMVRSVVVVVPAALTRQWREELTQKFRLDFVIARSEEEFRDSPCIITTYAAVRSRQGPGRHLRHRCWDLLVVDEAHKLKNHRSQQHRAVASMRRKYVLLLSATPFHNHLGELKSLVDVIKPGLLGSRRTFNRQFVDRRDPRRPRRVAHLRRLLDEVMIRRRRQEVDVRLPPRRAAVYHVEAGDAERAFYDALTALVTEQVAEIERAGRPDHTASRDRRRYTWVLTLITLQREVCSSPPAVQRTLLKLANDEAADRSPALRQHLRQLADTAALLPECRKAQACYELLDTFDGQFVIFVDFLATADYLAEGLKRRGIGSVRYHGGLDEQGRADVLDRFRGGERALIATRTGGEGLNIQFCHNLINYDLPWNPMSVEQRIGRVHRLGQEHDVAIFNLSLADTVEARVIELLAHKIRMFTAVLGEMDLILGCLQSDHGFEELVRGTWLQGLAGGRLNEAFEGLGRTLSSARADYDRIKTTEAILNEVFEP